MAELAPPFKDCNGYSGQNESVSKFKGKKKRRQRSGRNAKNRAATEFDNDRSHGKTQSVSMCDENAAKPYLSKKTTLRDDVSSQNNTENCKCPGAGTSSRSKRGTNQSKGKKGAVTSVAVPTQDLGNPPSLCESNVCAESGSQISSSPNEAELATLSLEESLHPASSTSVQNSDGLDYKSSTKHPCFTADVHVVKVSSREFKDENNNLADIRSSNTTDNETCPVPSENEISNQNALLSSCDDADKTLPFSSHCAPHSYPPMRSSLIDESSPSDVLNIQPERNCNLIENVNTSNSSTISGLQNVHTSETDISEPVRLEIQMPPNQPKSEHFSENFKHQEDKLESGGDTSVKYKYHRRLLSKMRTLRQLINETSDKTAVAWEDVRAMKLKAQEAFKQDDVRTVIQQKMCINVLKNTIKEAQSNQQKFYELYKSLKEEVVSSQAHNYRVIAASSRDVGRV